MLLNHHALGEPCVDIIYIGSLHCKATGMRVLMLMVLLVQAIAAVQISLLLRSGDVEKNPGPGLHPGTKHAKSNQLVG